jgi:penicillin amidase
MGRRLKRIALVLLAIALLAVAAALIALRGSLAPLDGKLALAGLSAPVRIERDALGTVTIEAASEADAMRALGYVHAQERFFEMDLMRRSAAGELAALFGARALELDTARRQDRIRSRVRANLDAALGAKRDAVEAYTSGVNHGLASLRARPWPYLLLRARPQPWRVEDTPVVGYAMYYDLQDAGNARELGLIRVQPLLPRALFDLVTWDGSRWDAPLQGAPRGDAPLPGPEALDLRRLVPAAGTAPQPEPAMPRGSNNFAVSGRLTADGRAILADDMHLGLRAPNIWFRARLRYPDPQRPGLRIDVSGFSLPGTPGVTVGSNGHVALGFTNSYGDWNDWAALPGCGRAHCAGRRAHRERIEVAGGEPVDIVVEETGWGPIAEYRADGSALARRWVAHLPGAMNLSLIDMGGARTLDQALAVADRAAVPAQNLLLADASGRIAWRLLGPVPRRAAGCRPQALSDPATCPPWPIDTAGAPAIIEPTGGRLWTANARVVDGGFLQRMGDGGYVLGTRAWMIRDRLHAKAVFDERDLLAIQLDDRSLLLRPWSDLMLRQARTGNAPALADVAAAAPRLEPHASTDAVAYRTVRAWRGAVHARIRDGLLSPARHALGPDAKLPELPQLEAVAWPMASTQPEHLLPPGFDSWQQLFEDAAREVRDELAAKGPLAKRTWGDRNTAAICHPLAGALPFGRRLLCMPAEPLRGDSFTPRAQAPDSGASQRMVVSPGRERDGLAHMPGGQSGHPLSPFWGSGHDDWVHGRPTPFLPGPARHVLRLVPGANRQRPAH